MWGLGKSRNSGVNGCRGLRLCVAPLEPRDGGTAKRRWRRHSLANQFRVTVGRSVNTAHALSAVVRSQRSPGPLKMPFIHSRRIFHAARNENRTVSLVRQAGGRGGEVLYVDLQEL